MNARTCLLCGKTLSRIWVGAGEDFCSREHRNQYRLRRGMDRLQEANKVASLMRRRENPKAIPTLEYEGNSEVRMADASQIGFSAHRLSSILPATRWEPSVEIPKACGWIERYRTFIPDAEPRDSGTLRHPAPRLILNASTRRIDPPGANYRERIRQPRRLKSSGRTGQTLRVSAGAGFRLPAMRSRALHISAHTPAIQCPEQPRAGTVGSLDCSAAYTMLTVFFSAPNLVTPPSPVPVRSAALVLRGAIQFGKTLVPAKTAPATRASGERWTDSVEAMPRPIPHTGPSLPPPKFVFTPQRGTGGEPVPHLVHVPLMPQDMAFGYIPAIVMTPALIPPEPRASVQEQFDSGLEKWTGGVGDWVLDAAGARTGSLALLAPTLDQCDYELEFLARIEHRSLTWVFRAASLTEYYLATISATPAGGYEFTRGSVIRGAREIAVSTALHMAINRKNAITVRLRAVGDDFTVSLDGQDIDTWTDSRLPIGGIGFIGAPDDRARIYWVRLSPAGRPAKEYPKR
ncbi:MAG: hypothetical protein LAQ69_35705 [Acidobacteriia bacterium]|nr:hypothetical protein [Terriglobia bacterium]